jgi:hypothetical protein
MVAVQCEIQGLSFHVILSPDGGTFGLGTNSVSNGMGEERGKDERLIHAKDNSRLRVEFGVPESTGSVPEAAPSD